MEKHILLKYATRKPYTATPNMPDGATFDASKGYWIKDSSALITPLSDFGKQATKKCDQETGEDQKGE